MFTANKFTEYVNHALNYPAIQFDDIRPFLDQAISEINTELHTSIVDVDTMERAAKEAITSSPNIIMITKEETSKPIPTTSRGPDGTTNAYYFSADDNAYFVYDMDLGIFDRYTELYGVVIENGTPTIYTAGQVLATSIRYWYLDKMYSISDIDLENYFTSDWIKLFLVPYVAYKYSVRDGDTGRLFNEEFVQGFNQLRKSYNVPFQVILSTVADKFAYREDVTHHLPKLNIWNVTRAITQDMKNPMNVNAERIDFYDTGGFGL